jgi:predicted component of type VI protein secretion system
MEELIPWIESHNYDSSGYRLSQEQANAVATLERASREVKRLGVAKSRARKVLQDPSSTLEQRQQAQRKINELIEQENSARKSKTAIQTSEILPPGYFNKSEPYRACYTRYADDWILLTNANKSLCEEAKSKIAQYLDGRLKLTLAPEKTKITNIMEEQAKYLGFVIYRNKAKRFRKITIANPVKHSSGVKSARMRADSQNDLSDDEQGEPELIVYRPAMRQLIVGIDTERIIKRMSLKKIITPHSHSPREMPHLAVLTAQEIIVTYNQMMMGFAQYYYPIVSYTSYINRWIYFLYYSCLKTLATKFRLSIKQITDKYSYMDVSPSFKPNTNAQDKLFHNRQRIVYPYTMVNKKNEQITRFAVLLNYQEVIARCAITRFNSKFRSGLNTLEIDLLTAHKRYFRTAFKFSTCCCICGSIDKLQMHHIRKLQGNRSKGFTKVLAQLGRKQIPVCAECHHNIHTGQYDGVSLRELYSSKVAIAEGSIKYYPELEPEIPTKLWFDDPTQQASVLKKQILFNENQAYVYDHDLRHIISRHILAWSHGPKAYKINEARFDDIYYSAAIKRTRNSPIYLEADTAPEAIS